MSSRDDKLYIGIVLEGAKVKTALVDTQGKILFEQTDPTAHRKTEELTRQLIELIQTFKQKAPQYGHLIAVGVGVPGLINLKTNKIEVLPNLPQISTTTLYDDIMQATGVQVIFDNDANLGAYGEWQCGAAQGHQNVIYVTIGTGIGSGIILNGRMWRGTTGFAGELGHTTINIDGIECACGNIGCLETVASGPNIVRRMQQRLYRDRTSSLTRFFIPRDREMTPEDIVQAALSGDELAQVVFERTGHYLGIALGGLINLLNPEMVIFGGSIMAVGNILLNPIIAETKQRAFGPCFDNCKIVNAQLGPLSGVIGAAILARDIFK
ncbi:MAG: ROK family protein [Acidobacteria bacterium]|nr:ROK family protein [Acidobacteriota bacterium]